jgi:hypothetical protein
MSSAAEVDFEAVKAAAEGYREDMTRFLRASSRLRARAAWKRRGPSSSRPR